MVKVHTGPCKHVHHSVNRKGRDLALRMNSAELSPAARVAQRRSEDFGHEPPPEKIPDMRRLPSTIPALSFVLFLLLSGCSSAERSGDRSEGSSGGNLIRMDDVEALGYSSIEELLIARVPGVRRSPGGRGIIIRGTRTIRGSNAPLYVVDGVPSSASPTLSLHDVHEIEVLKSPTEVAKFGSRGMHGVVLIRTKKP